MWNMGELQTEARDGYSNRVILKVQGKSSFDMKMFLPGIAPAVQRTAFFYKGVCFKKEVLENDINK